MSKKVITQYALPLTDAERKEILDMLKPAYIQKEKAKVARELQRCILDEITNHLNAIAPQYDLNVAGGPFNANYLNGKLYEKVSEWYDHYAMRLGSNILHDDIFATVSTDGLFVIEYSETAKKIITTHDFELEVLEYKLPDNDADLVRAANERLEQEPIEQ